MYAVLLHFNVYKGALFVLNADDNDDEFDDAGDGFRTIETVSRRSGFVNPDP